MSEKRSDEAYYAWLTSASKLDYFIAGVALAATSYLAAELEPVRLGVNAASLETVAVVLLLASSVAALKRIEASVTAIGAMQRRLRSAESAGAYTEAAHQGGVAMNRATGEVIDAFQAFERALVAKRTELAAKGAVDKWADRSRRWYKTRNILLYVGLLAYVAAQVLAAYG